MIIKYQLLNVEDFNLLLEHLKNAFAGRIVKGGHSMAKTSLEKVGHWCWFDIGVSEQRQAPAIFETAKKAPFLYFSMHLLDNNWKMFISDSNMEVKSNDDI